MGLKMPEVSIDELLLGKFMLIDVRSPGEFEEFHVPNAINLPLFSNDERATVGTIYKQQGKEVAKDLGMEILSKKLPNLYQSVKQLDKEAESKGQELVIYCARGGMRSGSVVTISAMMGIKVSRLIGGIRAYRQVITNGLTDLSLFSKPFVVLEGNTGTRKSDILQCLQEEGYPVVDLEGIANHRGSIFGAIGLHPVSQKQFECRLWRRLKELKDAPYILIEAESKRIGKVVIPDLILNRKETGMRIHIDAPMDMRVDAICKSYKFHEYHGQLVEAVNHLQKRLPSEIKADVIQLASEKKYKAFVRLLLEEYYDPRYKHKARQYDTPVYPITIQDLQDGVIKVKAQLNKMNLTKQSAGKTTS